MKLTYQLLAGKKFTKLARVHSTGARDIMCFIERDTNIVYEAQSWTTRGRIANQVDTRLYLGIAQLAVWVES